MVSNWRNFGFFTPSLAYSRVNLCNKVCRSGDIYGPDDTRDIFLTMYCIASPLLVVSRSVFLIVPHPPIYIPRWLCVTMFVDQGGDIDLMTFGIYRLLPIVLRLPFWRSPVCSFLLFRTLNNVCWSGNGKWSVYMRGALATVYSKAFLPFVVSRAYFLLISCSWRLIPLLLCKSSNRILLILMLLTEDLIRE